MELWFNYRASRENGTNPYPYTSAIYAFVTTSYSSCPSHNFLRREQHKPIYPIKPTSDQKSNFSDQKNAVKWLSNPIQPRNHPNWIIDLTKIPSLILSCLFCFILQTRSHFYLWSPLIWFCTHPRCLNIPRRLILLCWRYVSWLFILYIHLFCQTIFLLLCCYFSCLLCLILR